MSCQGRAVKKLDADLTTRATELADMQQQKRSVELARATLRTEMAALNGQLTAKQDELNSARQLLATMTAERDR